MYNRNQNIISHILQTPVEPKSRNVLWDNGTLIKIWRKEGWVPLLGSNGEDLDLSKYLETTVAETMFAPISIMDWYNNINEYLEYDATSSAIICKTNLIVQGDTSSEGSGSDNPGGGLAFSGILYKDKHYSDFTVDNYLNINSLVEDLDLSQYVKSDDIKGLKNWYSNTGVNIVKDGWLTVSASGKGLQNTDISSGGAAKFYFNKSDNRWHSNKSISADADLFIGSTLYANSLGNYGIGLSGSDVGGIITIHEKGTWKATAIRINTDGSTKIFKNLQAVEGINVTKTENASNDGTSGVAGVFIRSEGGIELSHSSTPYIDFHANQGTEDFPIRIAAAVFSNGVKQLNLHGATALMTQSDANIGSSGTRWNELYCKKGDFNDSLNVSKNVTIGENLVVAGDVSSGGNGQDIPTGINEAKLKEYLDTNKYIDESELLEYEYASKIYVDNKVSTKVDKISGKGLSTNDFTTTLLNKLNGIAENAEVNVRSDWNATDGDALILNKPILGTLSSKNIGATSGTYLMSTGGDVAWVNATSIKTAMSLGRADVGLGSVENTALSTWKGTSSITTLGTITSGTWQGTKIANAYLANNAMTIAGTSVSLGGSIAASTITAAQIGSGNSFVHSGNIANQSVTSSLVWSNTSSLNTANADNIANVTGWMNTSTGSTNIPASGGTIMQFGTPSQGKVQFFAGYKGDSSSSGSHGIYFRKYYPDYGWDAWKEFITSGNIANQNVNSANKLTTSRTLWGNSFNGTSDISGHIKLGNEIAIKCKTSDGSEKNVLLINYANNLFVGPEMNGVGDTYITGNSVYFRYGSDSTVAMKINSKGYLGLGTSNPEYKLHIVGDSYINGNAIITGDTSSGSDIRFKDIIENKTLNIDTIANAPLFTFKWNNKDDNFIHLGTSAQYWENVCEGLVNGEEFKTLNYASLGVAMGISLAKRLLILEKENNCLKEELRRIKHGC